MSELSEKLKLRWLDQGHDRVRRSKNHEIRVAKLLGGKRLPASGAKKWSKWDAVTERGDISTKEFHIEHKRTDKESIILKSGWLTKISSGAKDKRKNPGLIVTFDSIKNTEKDWAIIPAFIFAALVKKAFSDAD